jgi:hypothetical protein
MYRTSARGQQECLKGRLISLVAVVPAYRLEEVHARNSTCSLPELLPNSNAQLSRGR